MRYFLIALMMASARSVWAGPHPETGLQYWAIQADPIAGEIIGFGRITRITYLADERGTPQETKVELVFERVMEGVAVTNALVVEPGQRFQDITFDRNITKTFVIHLQPSRDRKGFITYWDGFGVREASRSDSIVFERCLREWRDAQKPSERAAQRVAMMEWGLRCAEHSVTRWEGVLAIRDAVHPGDEYREHAGAMKVVTPERWERIRSTWRRVRDDRPRDYRIGTALMEALAWMTPDPLFHHEVRFWSAKLRQDDANWARHLDGFWRQFEKKSQR